MSLGNHSPINNTFWWLSRSLSKNRAKAKPSKQKSAEANADALVAALVLLTGSPSWVEQDLLNQLQSLDYIIHLRNQAGVVCA